MEKETSMKRRAIFIGRFQPLHLGHKQTILDMGRAKDLDELVIGIGSAQYYHTVDNPFTYKEREEMIFESLKIEKPYQVIPIIDLYDSEKWVRQVLKLCPSFQVVYTGNTLVRKLFLEAGFEIRDVNSSYNISSTDIRERMIIGKDWQDLVPDGTRKVIENSNGAARLREIYGKN